MPHEGNSAMPRPSRAALLKERPSLLMYAGSDELANCRWQMPASEESHLGLDTTRLNETPIHLYTLARRKPSSTRKPPKQIIVGQLFGHCPFWQEEVPQWRCPPLFE